jgi:hypothetical protein
MTNCTNLLEQYGSRFRVFNEVEGRRAYARDDEWDLVLVGSNGKVVLWSRTGTLCACTNSRGMTNRLLAAVPGAKVEQDGSDGQNITFEPEHLETVAKLLRLRRRKQVTPEQREAGSLRLAKFRFESARGAVSPPQIPPIDPPDGGECPKTEFEAKQCP